MISLFVLTSPRLTDDPWQYVTQTVEQIDADGDLPCERHLVVDADEVAFDELARRLLDRNWRLHRFERPAAQQILGNKLPYFHLLELAHRMGCDELVALEDDLELCRNAALRMLLFPVPRDLSWVSFYNGWTLTGSKMNPGLWRVPPTPMQGCQALKFPRRTLEQLVEWSKGPEFTMYNESDVALGLAQTRLDMRFGCHCPDLVQHEGGVSRVEAIVRQQNGIDPLDPSQPRAALLGRQSLNYVGRTFDALSLFKNHRLYR